MYLQQNYTTSSYLLLPFFFFFILIKVYFLMTALSLEASCEVIVSR